MLREDNNGFVHFPIPGKMIDVKNGKTFVYIVAFDAEDVTNNAYTLSNLRLVRPSGVVSDDVSPRVKNNRVLNMSVDELIKSNLKEQEFENIYFPNTDNEDDFKSLLSIPMTTCICIGWSENIYEIKEDLGFWSASFRDLTNEGRKLYYSIKKLHNNKEVRMLTFNTF